MATTTIFPLQGSKSKAPSLPHLDVDSAVASSKPAGQSSLPVPTSSSAPAPKSAPKPAATTPAPGPASSGGSGSSSNGSSPKSQSSSSAPGGGSGTGSGTDAHRVLSHAEWTQFCRGIGVLKMDDGGESGGLSSGVGGGGGKGGGVAVSRATSRAWPPRGLRDGLYRDIVAERAKYHYRFHVLSGIRWALLVVQIALNAVLTALGSSPDKLAVVITTLAAINTCNSGMLALMHNSGLPDRYRSDCFEFVKVHDYVKEIVDTAVVPAGHSVSDVLSDCFRRFQTAQQTVQNNVPSSYTPSANPAQPAAAAGGGASAPATKKK
ncbi:hypothetical protein GGR56DRAFT_672950 [Xylariaceae sp. FL0804]|nr:hypothetical protein GGR56DRAFT_672950 [Xylariaceae sp. FL0804]